MEPKVTDFGLSRCFDDKQSRIFTQNLRGTLGYIAPEFIDKGEISFKSDIFSLGVIMIKLLTGNNEYDTKRWHESLDIDLPQMKRCINIAKSCVDSEQHNRPTIGDIIHMLQMEGTNSFTEEMKRMKLFRPYNIIPFTLQSGDQTIMHFPEIQATVCAIQNIQALQWPIKHGNPDDEKHTNKDIFDWLQAIFGFQEDNVSNQREHLILLLANVQIRYTPKSSQQLKLDDQALDAVMKRLLKNYRKWCRYLGCRSNLWLPTMQLAVQQHKLLYISLYLLIWGEAANLRHMPECLCYIFHNMAFELHGMLAGHVNPLTGEPVKPAYGGDKETFLMKIVTPIYKVIMKETERCKSMKSEHSCWRNYDDLNEYFWSINCFKLGWPMREDADFFRTPNDAYPNHLSRENIFSIRNPSIEKVNFVEIRSFWHIFRSFHRLWTFLILSLQVMVIIAWHDVAPSAIFKDGVVFKHILSIFVTAAILNMGQAFLEILFGWKARRSMPFAVWLRYVLKMISATAWVIILPATYAHTLKNPIGPLKRMSTFLGGGQKQPLLFLVSSSIYLAPNLLAAMLFLFPLLRRLLEGSDVKLAITIMWWCQPCLFVGRKMHEGIFSILKYTMFWVLLLAMKLTVNFYIEIKPLVHATKEIMREPIRTFQNHNNNNIGVTTALWAPVILIYFTDIQIFFALFTTLIGGIYGDYHCVGEIKTVFSLRSRFESLIVAFNERMIPREANKDKIPVPSFGSGTAFKDEIEKQKIAARYARTWNLIITSFREEDLINDRERDLLLFPRYGHNELGIIQWPLFLVTNKTTRALDMAVHGGGNDYDLKHTMQRDPYFSYAIRECYCVFKSIINALVVGQREIKVVQGIFTIVDKHIAEGSLVKALDMTRLPFLYMKSVELLQLLLENKKENITQVVILFQDMLEVVIVDTMKKHEELRRLVISIPQDPLFTNGIRFPVERSNAWLEKIERLYRLLTIKESSIDVPANPNARRRILFFASSLFMEMPSAPKVHNMPSFSVLTPHHHEDVFFSSEILEMLNEDKVSILLYLQKVYPDEWKNFLERVHFKNEEFRRVTLEEETCLWAAYRLQTLTRTVRGIMYYRKALEFQTFLDLTEGDDSTDGYGATDMRLADSQLITECKALADIKFTYVVSCPLYGMYRRIGDPRAYGIHKLMAQYPSLRVAYIDEVEEFNEEQDTKEKVYYSTLVKVGSIKPTVDPAQDLDEVIYRIKLPGDPTLGELNPENQNHAVIFTRGECLQTISPNQDQYIEEALKMRNLLQEFLDKCDGMRYPSIIGVREHIFTGSVSCLGWFMSNQESTFVTIGQRVLAHLLRVRFYYGHSDIFDRLFHITRGGVSKASKTINLSEGISGGFNSTLRGGSITHREYMQVGKGIDVGLQQITHREAIKAIGNSEQTLSRDIYRLAQHFDFFRLLSLYYTTIGSYFSAVITVWTIYVFLYGRLYLIHSGLDEALITETRFLHKAPLQMALASQSFVHLGFLMLLPMVMEIGLERGFIAALFEFVLMHLQLASAFLAFTIGTKTHYYENALIYGATEYRSCGRGFVVFHAKFSENYRKYSRSHFVKGMESLILLFINVIFGQTYRWGIPCILITISMWLIVISWLCAPFLFNPSAFEWQKIMEDWSDWNKWMSNHGGFGVPSEKSWESWWEEQQKPIRESGRCGNIVQILLALRFFVYQYALIYNLNIAKHIHNIMVDGLSLVVIFVILLIMKTEPVQRRRLNVGFELIFPWIKCAIFVRFFYIIVLVTATTDITILEIFVFMLGFIPTGWGFLLIAQAMKPAVDMFGMWESIKALARVYDNVMGLLLLTPIVLLSWFPAVSELQSRMLFNEALYRGLQMSRILAGYKED